MQNDIQQRPNARQEKVPQTGMWCSKNHLPRTGPKVIVLHDKMDKTYIIGEIGTRSVDFSHT